MHPVVIAFAICALACAIGHVAILVSVIGRRATPVDPGVPRSRLALEITWAVIPALVLALVLTATWGRVRDHARQDPRVMMNLAR